MSTIGDAQSAASDLIFNSLLFNATNLGGHQHHLTFQNMFLSYAAPFVDIDYMVITSGDGNAQCVSFLYTLCTMHSRGLIYISRTQSADVWLDDGAHNITYSDGWDTSPNGLEASYYMNIMQ